MAKDATEILGFQQSRSGPITRVSDRSPQALAAFANAFMERDQFRGWPGRGREVDLLDDTTVVTMYVNDDRWVGDCPHCNSGIAGLLGVDECICLHCGRRMPASFPAPQAIAEAEVVLDLRPDPKTRNWNVGEDVSTLKLENITRGVPIVRQGE